MAYTNNAITALGDIDTVFRDVYWPGFLETVYLHGSETNRVFQPSTRTFNGKTMEVQAATSHSHPWRAGRDIGVVFDVTKKFRSGSFILTASETEASMDFAVLRASVRVSDMELQRAADSAAIAVDVAERLAREITTGYNTKTAGLTHLSRQALIGLVNGAPVANDAIAYADCSAIGSASSGGIRIKVDSGQFGIFKPGLRIGIHNPATTRAVRDANADHMAFFEIMDSNPYDFSVGLAPLPVEDDSEAAAQALAEYVAIDLTLDLSSNCTVADNDEIYVLGEKYNGTLGKGMNSLGEWFNAGSTLYTRNRSSAEYRWMNPLIFPGSGGAISMTDFNTVARGMGYEKPGSMGNPYVAIAPPEIVQGIINDIFADITPYSSIPTDGSSIMARFGYDGVVYHHHTFGAIKIIEDALAPANKVRFLRLGDWERVKTPGHNPFRVMPGNISGMFSRAVNGSGSPTTEYQADFWAMDADICTAPRLQAELNNITGV